MRHSSTSHLLRPPRRPLAVTRLFVGAGLVASIAVTSSGWAKDDESEEAPTIQKTKEGLHFQLPEDWPVERRGGVVAPVPIEEYLSKKFKGVDAQLQSLEQRLNGLDIRVRALEERANKQQQGLRSTETGP